jgi:glutathione S-transferase
MILYHFPGCPYSERVEILLALKGLSGVIEDVVLDISQPRPDWLLAKAGGSTALPVLEIDGRVLRESVIILRYLDSMFPDTAVIQRQPVDHAIESLMGLMDSGYAKAGYALLMNRDAAMRAELRAGVDAQYRLLDEFLRRHGGAGPFLFDDFGWAEVIMTPILKRLQCLDYYDDYEIPPDLTRVRAWHQACLAAPVAQSRTLGEVIRLYYDYSRGVGGGRLVPGRLKSSFALDPPWNGRPMPPRDKWGDGASDAELGLA